MRLAYSAVALLVLLTSTCPRARGDFVVNIDATVSGYNGLSTFPPEPVVGHLLAPVSPVQLVLGPGVYTITNASSGAGILPGANPDFQGWRFDGGATHWVWVFVMADAATNRIIGGGDADPDHGNSAFPSQLAAASDPAVENFMTTLTLSRTTTVDFMIRDFGAGLVDNAGGIALNVAGIAVPEPSSLILVAIGGAMARVVPRFRRDRGYLG